MASWNPAQSRLLPAISKIAPIAHRLCWRQQALKKAVRVAGKRFTAPPELYASIQRQMMPKRSVGLWFKWSALAASAVLVALVSFALLSRPSASSATVAQLIDQHVTMLASANPVDVISSDKHTVKPWYQGSCRSRSIHRSWLKTRHSL